jgi:hypothetical protein
LKAREEQDGVEGSKKKAAPACCRDLDLCGAGWTFEPILALRRKSKVVADWI